MNSGKSGLYLANPHGCLIPELRSYSKTYGVLKVRFIPGLCCRVSKANMHLATHDGADATQAAVPPLDRNDDFVPLDQETRTHVTTSVMCRHLNRKEQTARAWACLETGPIRPIRVNGRLAWPVSDIRRLLGVA